MTMTQRVGAYFLRRSLLFGVIYHYFGLLVLILGEESSGFENNVRPCPGNPSISGYASINDMKIDMQDEIRIIDNGGTPQDAYIFVLCPFTQFDTTSDSLIPLLDNSIFFCGDQGDVDDSCQISGGSILVVIRDSEISNYVINEVSFVGVTFSGFTDTAISGDALSTTTVKIDQSRFQV
jgi:hypothetical protein